MSFLNAKMSQGQTEQLADHMEPVQDERCSGEKACLKFHTKPMSDFRNEINVNANPNQGLYILSSFGKTDMITSFKTLIDCGAAMSLLHVDTYAKIPDDIKPQIRPTLKEIRLADGSFTKCDGIVTMTLQVGGTTKEVDFLLGKYSDEAILGINDLQSLGICIDFENFKVSKGSYWIPCVDVQSTLVGRKVVVRRSVILPGRSQAIFQAEVEGLENKITDCPTPVMLQPNKSMASELGILPAKGIYQLVNEGIPVMMYNPNEEDVELVLGTIIGELNEVSICPETESIVDVRKVKTSSDGVLEELPQHLADLYERSSELLSSDEQKRLVEVLTEYSDVFSKDDFDIGNSNLVEHKIETGDAKPVKNNPRRFAPAVNAAADVIVQDLLDRKLIRPSKSPWSSPIVMARRKDGAFRLCLDFRGLNKVSKTDAYPLPRIDDTLESLGKAKWYCTADLASGYWQIKMEEKSIEKTAFCTRQGLYEWLVMPFGLSSAVATFQRLMETILSDMRYTCCLVYIDDLFLYGPTVDTTFDRLEELCKRLRNANLKLKPKKCAFFQKTVVFLGHKVTENGIETDPSKVAAIKEWEPPTDKTGVKSYLGTVGYYKRFIPDYSNVAKPLSALTGKDVPFIWDSECQISFDKLKSSLISGPVLGYPNDDGMYILDTDASKFGLGGVLSQIQNDQEVVIAYGSRTLTQSELNYCVTRKELLAVLYHVKLFRSYLLGKPFLIRTDHASLKYWRRFKDPVDQLGRWLDYLAPFEFEIQARPGINHGNADGLSRQGLRCSETEKNKCYCEAFEDLEFEPEVKLESKKYAEVCTQVTPDHFESSCRRVIVVDRGPPIIEDYSCGSQISQTKVSQIDLGSIENVKVVSILPLWSIEDMVSAQAKDPDISPVLKSLQTSSQRPEWTTISPYSADCKILFSEWKRLELKDGMLYRQWFGDNGKVSYLQLVLPRAFWPLAVEHCHDQVTCGHNGGFKSYERVKARFFWPRMREFIRRWVASCAVCQQRKGPGVKAKAPLQIY